MGILSEAADMELHECDRCGVIFKETLNDAPAWKYIREINSELFYQRPNPIDHDKSLCIDCLKAITPLIINLRDIDETIIYVNYLQRSINAIRNKNYWPDANDASKGGIERLRRNIRNRASISAPQALEEHHRLPVL